MLFNMIAYVVKFKMRISYVFEHAIALRVKEISFSVSFKKTNLVREKEKTISLIFLPFG